MSGYSSYGSFVVIEHQWDSCPHCSLYAFEFLSVSVGRQVAGATRWGAWVIPAMG